MQPRAPFTAEELQHDEDAAHVATLRELNHVAEEFQYDNDTEREAGMLELTDMAEACRRFGFGCALIFLTALAIIGSLF